MTASVGALVSNPAVPISVIGPGLDREANAVHAAGLAENARAENTRRAGHGLDMRQPAIADVLRGLCRERGSTQRRAETLTVPPAQARACRDRGSPRVTAAPLPVGAAAALTTDRPQAPRPRPGRRFPSMNLSLAQGNTNVSRPEF